MRLLIATLLAIGLMLGPALADESEQRAVQPIHEFDKWGYAWIAGGDTLTIASNKPLDEITFWASDSCSSRIWCTPYDDAISCPTNYQIYYGDEPFLFPALGVVGLTIANMSSSTAIMIRWWFGRR